MTEFSTKSPYDPILSSEHNALLDHGLEKAASYVIRKNGSYYEAIKGGTSSGAGMITYGGSGNAGGATGSDCIEVIQAAANALTSGGLIHFAQGTFGPMDTYIEPKDEVYFEGEGYNTILDFSDDLTGTTTRAIYGYNHENWGFRNLRFVGGNDSNYEPSQVFLMNGDGTNLYGNFYLDHVWIEDFIKQSAGCTYIQNTNGPVYVTNCVFDNIYRAGVVLDKAKNVFFTNNFINDYDVQGIDVEPTADVAIENIHITNNTFVSGASTKDHVAINLFLTTNQQLINVENNHVYCNSKGSGIRVTRGKNVHVDGNTVYKADQASAWGIKIRGCTDATVLGNMVSDSTSGIVEEDYGGTTSDYNTIKGNVCGDGNTTAYTILVPCTNTLDGQASSPTPSDLSAGAAETQYLLHTETPMWLAQATLLYTEASSADAGVTLEIGKESDRNYYYTGTSETGKAQWYTNTVTLLQNDIAAGDTLTFYNPGGKVGTGEVICVIDYLTGA